MALAMILALAMQAEAPPEAAKAAQTRGPVILSGLQWNRLPSPQALRNAIPSRAKHDRISGRAVMSCKVDDAGKLVDCVVVEETPPGYKLGEAALGLAKFFQLKPPLPDGKRVGGGTVRIPLTFNGGA